MEKVELVLADKYRKKDGPFFSSLVNSMATLHLEHQAYHRATFVGNHVHKLLNVSLLPSYIFHCILYCLAIIHTSSLFWHRRSGREAWATLKKRPKKFLLLSALC